MKGRTPVSRRKPRSWRITAAVGVLGVASLVVAGALVTGDLFLVGAAGVFALAGGWVALRLAWTAIVQSRFENALDRTELARTYRNLFAERSVEHQAFVTEMSTRLGRSNITIHELRGSLAGVEMRAVEAETDVRTYRRRLTTAEGRIASMEEMIAAARQAHAEQQAREQESPQGRRRSETERDALVPEWADMEVDPVAALLAWEEHASHLSGRHSGDERFSRPA
jgi:signal transduction histidine kinase